MFQSIGSYINNVEIWWGTRVRWRRQAAGVSTPSCWWPCFSARVILKHPFRHPDNLQLGIIGIGAADVVKHQKQCFVDVDLSH